MKKRPPRNQAPTYFAPLASGHGRVILAVLGFLWLLTTAISVIWWFEAVQAPTPEGLLFNSAVLAFDAVVLPLWILFFARRMRRPIHNRLIPQFKVAMVVTKAPSEKWEVVKDTLNAMLDQDFPYHYDVWLADEDPSKETLDWCEEHGIGVTTRRGNPEYHRDEWPRRTRCKEGNLAYFYDTVGYKNYDIVSQLDADHVPEKTYLRHIVAPFENPKVGYVAAPSICDNNAEHSWSARGRLYSESILHGAIQAGCNDGWAPACIGSHYAVRTKALKEVGGLGPELAEDFSTTLLMASNRWEGAFAIDAEAHGDGPETVTDCITQDFQWSRSMITLGLTLAPKKLPSATWRARLRLGSCLAWYPLYALAMFASFAIPIVALMTGEALVRVDLGSFYYHLILPLILLILVAYWLRYLGAMRPKNAKVISWEAVLFQLIRWPWAFIGAAQAGLGWMTGKQFQFKVTPKDTQGRRPIPVKVILSYLFISMASGLCVILVDNPSGAEGYYFLALLNTIIYLTVASVILVLHLHEQHWALPTRKRRLRLALSIIVVFLIGTMAIITRGETAVSTITESAPPVEIAEPSPYPLKLNPKGHVAIGVTTQASAENINDPWTLPDLNQVNDFERAIKGHVDIIMWFADWERGQITREQLEAVLARGSIPEITWEPWDGQIERWTPQPKYSMKSILAGNHDSYIRSQADVLRDFKAPVILRFAQEMNVPGTGYPWAQPEENTPREYVAGWRYVHDIFEKRGAKNVRWVWSPLARNIPKEYYPGKDYVDIIGLSGFNGGSELPWAGWRSFEQIFSNELDAVKLFAPNKPVQIAEVSTASGRGKKADKGKWVASMFRTIRSYPQVRSVIWFNANKEAEWRLQSSLKAEESFSEAVAKPWFGHLPHSEYFTRER